MFSNRSGSLANFTARSSYSCGVLVINSLRSTASKKLQKRVIFEHSSITDNKQEDGKFDVCIAMGVIGYFKHDSELFNEVKRLLKPGGIFLVSCRNQLFNMQSISFRTASEINNNNAISLIDEIEGLYSRIPVNKANDMVEKLAEFRRLLTNFVKLTLSN